MVLVLIGRGGISSQTCTALVSAVAGGPDAMETCTSSGSGTEYVGSADPNGWAPIRTEGTDGGASVLRGLASRLERVRGRAEWQGQPGHKSQVAGHRQAAKLLGEEGRRTRERRFLSGVPNRHTGHWTRRRPCSDEGRQGEEDEVLYKFMPR
ncbi:hypothetical protein EDB80DRAFT_719192 [Ilyonectria destructans]|nr:hypothetical protein EDB80DRAFT_719192 [Ilyonectria destructans]